MAYKSIPGERIRGVRTARSGVVDCKRCGRERSGNGGGGNRKPVGPLCKDCRSSMSTEEIKAWD